ncbi:hypothetical protein Salat_2159300 [Sesamum alatum]|uniref:DUF4283 domain-containing protein n=1 Tax=Sesamum alatum TaxID=300844 RepID=A0AAE1Y2V2_9LAMI|nr:hypothetical protein Salat_2159300 [Sesamum alatum]
MAKGKKNEPSVENVGCSTMKPGQLSTVKATTTGQPSSVPVLAKVAAVGQPATAQPSTVSSSAMVNAKLTGKTAITKVGSMDIHAFISNIEASPSVPPKPGHVGDTSSHRPAVALPGKEIVTEAGDDGALKLESNDLIDVKVKLGFCLVGYIAGKFPGFKAIPALAQTWGASFQQYESGWLIFRFARVEDHLRILAVGPYFVYRRPLLLKNMPDCFEFKEDDISLTLVWAILPSLPLECWYPNALGKIGSRLGTPIATDTLTRKMERVSYARILVEVDASKLLVDNVEFILPNSVTRKQPVVYEFTPKFCLDCSRYGHLKDSYQGSQP